MNWKLCIDTPEQKALDLCYGSMKMGHGYGDGCGYGDGNGEHWNHSYPDSGDGYSDGVDYGCLHVGGGGYSSQEW